MKLNLFKKLTLVNKVQKVIKQIKNTIDTNKGLADEFKRIIGNLKLDIDALLVCAPQLKPIYKDILNIIEEVWK